MMKFRRFLDHYGLLVFFAIGLVAIAAAFWRHWADPKTLEALATIFVTVVLALVTWQYVRTTQKTLALFKEQWDYQQQIGIIFGLKKRDGKAWLRIANTGGVRLFISKAVIRQRSKKTFTRNAVRVVGVGENYGFFIPRGVYKYAPYNCDVDITLHYQGHGKAEETMSKAFRMEMVNGSVNHIKAGIHEAWFVDCPKCGTEGMILMITTGLNNYDEAYQRESEVKEQLAITHPQHQSPWMDSIEQLRERQKMEKESGTIEE